MENEASSATTRQYARQQPASPYDTPYQSQLAQAHIAQGNRYGSQPPETSRLYPEPIAPNNFNNQANYPANYQQAATKKSGALKWILITLMCVMLVSGAISAMVISALRSSRGGPEESDRAGRIEPSPPASVRGSGLDQYKYPNATLETKVSGFGGDVLTMTTSDSVNKVRDYYQKRFGDPMIEASGSAVVFRIPGSPMTIITINQDEENSDKTRITATRTNMSFPKMN